MMFRGTAMAGVNMTCEVESKEEAIDYFFETIKEEYDDADFYDVSDVMEIAV